MNHGGLDGQRNIMGCGYRALVHAGVRAASSTCKGCGQVSVVNTTRSVPGCSRQSVPWGVDLCRSETMEESWVWS
jgi:hypothetical protein